MGANTCDAPASTSTGKPFIVGSANKVPILGTVMPAKDNVFYDNHLMFVQSTSVNCTTVRNQTYSCGGVDVSSHEITTTMSTTAPPSTRKIDVNGCINKPNTCDLRDSEEGR